MVALVDAISVMEAKEEAGMAVIYIIKLTKGYATKANKSTTTLLSEGFTRTTKTFTRM